MTTSHTWKFFRAGGFEQVQLDSGEEGINREIADSFFLRPPMRPGKTSWMHCVSGS